MAELGVPKAAQMRGHVSPPGVPTAAVGSNPHHQPRVSPGWGCIPSLPSWKQSSQSMPGSGASSSDSTQAGSCWEQPPSAVWEFQQSQLQPLSSADSSWCEEMEAHTAELLRAHGSAGNQKSAEPGSPCTAGTQPQVSKSHVGASLRVLLNCLPQHSPKSLAITTSSLHAASTGFVNPGVPPTAPREAVLL